MIHRHPPPHVCMGGGPGNSAQDELQESVARGGRLITSDWLHDSVCCQWLRHVASFGWCQCSVSHCEKSVSDYKTHIMNGRAIRRTSIWPSEMPL